MSTAELKNYLHQLIVETNDNSILAKVEEYFLSLKSEIPVSHKKEVLRRKESIEKGEMKTYDWHEVEKELFD